MNELTKVFQYHGARVRTLVKGNDPWFVLKDVCEVLGIEQVAGIRRRLSEDVISNHPLDTAGGIQTMTIINEDGLYDVILESRKPEARAFRKWITSEVLPSIRKTGSYGMPQLSPAEVLAGVANQLVEQERKLAALESTIDQTAGAVSTLTHGLTAVPDHTKVVDRVNEYARWTRLGHNEVYNKIYDIMQARHGIDVRQRVENERHRINIEHFNSTGRYYAESTLKKKVNGIDVMVRMGVLDKFNEILVGLLAKAKGGAAV